MFKTIRDKMPRDKDYPARQFELQVLQAVLEGTLYDCMTHQFHEEKSENGEYVPLRDRAPSVRYNVCSLVVDDSVALLFGDGRFPAVHSPNDTQRNALNRLVMETGLVSVMNDAAIRGSIGSVAVLMRVLNGRVFFKVMDTLFLTPTWKGDEPDTLEKVTERYKLKGQQLRAMGYSIDDDALGSDFWFQRDWTDAEEVWYLPVPTAKPKPGDQPVPVQRDEARTVKHDLGFVPMVWIRNLPGRSATRDFVDGACTFKVAIDTQIEIEYQLSQAGRGLKYSSDPTLLIKEPAGDDSEIVKGAGHALVVTEKGDAKLLEIGGTAAAAVIEYCRHLREQALEMMHGNRASADRLVVAQSGKAMELMHQALIWLADRLRTSYGTALSDLLCMVARVPDSFKLIFRDGDPVGGLPEPKDISLRWQPWFHMTTQDQVQQAQALQTSRQGGFISRESAVSVATETWDIPDAPGEITRVLADIAEEDARTIKLAAAAAQAKTNETVS